MANAGIPRRIPREPPDITTAAATPLGGSPGGATGNSDGPRGHLPKLTRSKMAEHVGPFKGDCKNRRCPFGCDAGSTPRHQKETVLDHLSIVLAKLRTLEANMDKAEPSGDALSIKAGELEGKVAGLASQLQFLQRANGEAAAKNASLAAQQSTFETIVAVLNRQLEKILIGYNGMLTQRRLHADLIKRLQRKVTSLERSLALKDNALAEQDLRIQALEMTSFDGVMVWPITDISRKRQEAVGGRTLCIYSPSFYTSRRGYNMCCGLYLNGAGMGKGTHIALFCEVIKGQYDAIVPWPFRQKVTVMLLDQAHRDHIIDEFTPDPTRATLRRPSTEEYGRFGSQLLCRTTMLEGRDPTYVKEDTLFIKVIVDDQEEEESKNFSRSMNAYLPSSTMQESRNRA